jgi:hypothetical protein
MLYKLSRMTVYAKQIVVSASEMAAFAIPLAIAILTASPEPYWLDSPEFTAAAQTLGIPHPPGHPLYVMLAKPFTLIPLGGIALRVALASAVFGALATLLLYKIIFTMYRVSAPGLPSWMGALISCSTVLVTAVAPGWWFQTIRAEVYSLQILLVLGALYPVLLFCLENTTKNHRLLYLAAFIAGLGMTNHHFIMLVALPAAIPPLVAEARYLGGMGALKLAIRLAVTGIAGLLPYLFLPIRSASFAAVSLGGVHSLRDFFWVVSARIYQKSMTKEHESHLMERSMDSLFTMMGQVSPVILVASFAGLYLLLRRPKTRLAGLVLFLLISVTILMRSIMGFDPFNPDYLGYMLPAVAGLAIGFSAFAFITIDTLRTGLRRGPILAVILTVAFAIVPIARARQTRPKVDLSDFRATRLLTDLALSKAVPGTTVLAFNYKLFFVLWSARFIDGSRPDVRVINPMMFVYPGYMRSTLIQYPELRHLVRSMLVHGKLTESAVADLAWKGPIRIEPNLELDDAVIRYMLPDAPIYQTSPEPLSSADVSTSSVEYSAGLRTFYDLLGPTWNEQETHRFLQWTHYQDALFLARRGDRKGAKKAVEMSLAIGSKSPEILLLQKALDKGGKGPIDVTPYLPQRNRP